MFNLKDNPRVVKFVWLAGGILFAYGLHWIGTSLSDVTPPTPQEARKILNDCEAFTLVGQGSRRAELVTALGSPDSGGEIGVYFKWRWTSQEKLKDANLHDSHGALLLSISDKKWHLAQIQLPDGNWDFDACKVVP